MSLTAFRLARRLLPAIVLALVLAGIAPSCISAGHTGARVVSPLAYENAGRGGAILHAEAGALRKQANESEMQLRTLIHAEDTTGRESLLSTLDASRIQDPATLANAKTLAANMQTLESQAANTEAAAVQLETARAAGESVYASGFYFTVEPLVAIGPGLEATAIPALGVNWRFGDEGDTPLALQLVFGGALNPQSSDSSLGAAVGLGLSHPVSDSGAISLGFVFWDDGNDVQNGVYVSFNLGSFGKTAK